MVRFDTHGLVARGGFAAGLVVSCLPLDKMKSINKPTVWRKGLTRQDGNPAHWAAKVTNYIKARKRDMRLQGLGPIACWHAHEALRLEAHKKYNLRLARKLA